MDELTEIANRCKTDKGNLYNCFCQPNGKGNYYTAFYEPFFKKYKSKHVNILELGVMRGESLKMWNEYYNHNCTIYGVDINPNCKEYETENTHILLFDSGNREQIQNFKKSIGDIKFDIILDDASHKSNDQLIALANLCDMLTDDGIYVVEDLQTSIIWDVDNIKDRTLFFLNFHNTDNKYLTKNENSTLLNKIDTKTFFSRNKNDSITCVLTFNK